MHGPFIPFNLGRVEASYLLTLRKIKKDRIMFRDYNDLDQTQSLGGELKGIPANNVKEVKKTSLTDC